MRFSVIGMRITLGAIMCAALVGGLFAVVGGTHAAGSDVTTYSGHPTTIASVGTADPLHATNAATSAKVVHDKLVHSLHPAAKAASQAQHASSMPSGNESDNGQNPGRLLTSFNGVSSLDSEVTNFGARFEPPDQGLCVGNGFVVEPVNSAYTIYRTDGSVVAGPFNVNVLFHEGLTEFTSDPRCHYDKATNTWFAIILFISTDDQGNFTNSARTDIAVNTSGDPTTPWTVYHLDATNDGTNGTPNHPGCPCFGDQPRLGLDGQNLYISTDEFSILGPEFNGTQIYAVSKADLIQHAATVHVANFDNLSIGGAIAGGVQPALTYGRSDAEYFLGALDPTGTTDNRLGVWALTNREAVSRGGMPTLSSTVITSETYGVPPNAEQRGATSLLNTGDDRMQQVEFIDGNVWGALDTVLNIHGDSAPRSASAWFNVHPHLADTRLAGADIHGQGYVASKGNYLLYPAIAVNRDGAAAMVMTLSGATIYPSAAYAVLQGGGSRFGAVHVAGAGTGPYDPKAGRWGDYSYAVLDPSGNSFWFATEYIPPVASQTTGARRNWGTRVFQVSANG